MRETFLHFAFIFVLAVLEVFALTFFFLLDFAVCDICFTDQWGILRYDIEDKNTTNNCAYKN